MSHFIYKSKRNNGDIYKGEKDAEDKYELYKILKESGEEIIDIKESKFSFNIRKFFSFKLSIFNGINSQEKIIFAKNLGSMLSAGLSISRALSVMERQSKNKILKSILIDIQSSISQGKTLSDSLLKYKDIFSNLFISMVSAGERSGALSESLNVISIQLDKSYSLQRKVKGAMLYPAIILFAMISIAILMLTYIVPTLMKTFTELNLELPATTKFVLFASKIVTVYGLWVLLFTLISSFIIYKFSKTNNGKRIIHYSILNIPILGNIIKEVNSARTARTLSSLLSSGVDIIESIRITEDVIQNIYYKEILNKASVSIEKGDSISKLFIENTKYYPIFFGEMINVGEETGKIGEMLLGVAKFYEDDVEQKTKDMSTVIEPFLMILIAIVVGFFAVAMISPMYSLVNVI